MMNKFVVSKERKEYLNKIKQKKFLVIFTQIAFLVMFLIMWEFLANKKIIDSFITSQPSAIWETFKNLGSNGLSKHIGVTVYETIVGFSIGTVVGVIIAIILWWSDFLSKVVEPYLVVLNSLPKVALRTTYYNLGWSWNSGYYCNGGCNITYCNYIGKFKWIFKDG